jgi:hypothetical protein
LQKQNEHKKTPSDKMHRYLIFEAGGKYNYHCALKGADFSLIGGSQCNGYRDYRLLDVITLVLQKFTDVFEDNTDSTHRLKN